MLRRFKFSRTLFCTRQQIPRFPHWRDAEMMEMHQLSQPCSPPSSSTPVIKRLLEVIGGGHTQDAYVFEGGEDERRGGGMAPGRRRRLFVTSIYHMSFALAGCEPGFYVRSPLAHEVSTCAAAASASDTCNKAQMCVFSLSGPLAVLLLFLLNRSYSNSPEQLNVLKR